LAALDEAGKAGRKIDINRTELLTKRIELLERAKAAGMALDME
jgi:hypothetical protein